jgi:hypothetical protein
MNQYVFTTGLGAGVAPASTLDDRTAHALGMSSATLFTVPVLGTSATQDKTMLYIGIAGLAVAVLTYFKKGR